MEYHGVCGARPQDWDWIQSSMKPATVHNPVKPLRGCLRASRFKSNTAAVVVALQPQTQRRPISAIRCCVRLSTWLRLTRHVPVWGCKTKAIALVVSTDAPHASTQPDCH